MRETDDGEDLVSELKVSLKLIKAGRKIKTTRPTDMPEGVFLDREGNYLVPDSMAKRADIHFEATKLRLDLQKRVAKLKKLETLLDEDFIKNLSIKDATGIAGQVARIQVKPNPIPVIQSDTLLYAFIKKNNRFDLLQKRLNRAAVNEMLEAKEKVPGVTIFDAKKVSCTKL